MAAAGDLRRAWEALAEERRLLYVGITRARRHLALSWASQRVSATGKPGTRKPSRFLAALGVTAQEVREVLRANNYLAGIGQVKGDSVQIDLSTTTDVGNVEDFRNLVVREDNGLARLLRWRPLARIGVGGGFWTPASAFGALLRDRISQHAGLSFELIDISCVIDTGGGTDILVRLDYHAGIFRTLKFLSCFASSQYCRTWNAKGHAFENAGCFVVGGQKSRLVGNV